MRLKWWYMAAGRAAYVRVEPRAYPSQVQTTHSGATPLPLNGLVRGSEGLRERMTAATTAMLPIRRTWTFHCPHRPRAYPQQPPSVVDKPIKSWGVESVYFRCCWPRYTRNGYLYERAVLVGPEH